MITCKVHKFGDNINTDLISPAQYMELDNAGIALKGSCFPGRSANPAA